MLRMAAGTASPGPGAFAGMLGARCTAIADGRARFELVLGPQHMNPHGIAHGGVVYSLVDYAMGGALTSRLTAGERCTTLEIKINYLAPAVEGTIAAEAWVVERTGRVGVLEARAHAGDVLVALATGSFYIQGPRP
jgi:acyl-CoA thioesterase